MYHLLTFCGELNFPSLQLHPIESNFELDKVAIFGICRINHAFFSVFVSIKYLRDPEMIKRESQPRKQMCRVFKMSYGQ